MFILVGHVEVGGIPLGVFLKIKNPFVSQPLEYYRLYGWGGRIPVFKFLAT